MSDKHELPEGGAKESEGPEEQELEAGQPEDDDSTELRLQAQAVEYAQERAALAEQISQLQEENDWLQKRIQELEQLGELPPTTAVIRGDDHHPERALGLDFSLPKHRDKG